MHNTLGHNNHTTYPMGEEFEGCIYDMLYLGELGLMGNCVCESLCSLQTYMLTSNVHIAIARVLGLDHNDKPLAVAQLAVLP